jgi:uncharacterized protein YbjT (DUF2867 family)
LPNSTCGQRTGLDHPATIGGVGRGDSFLTLFADLLDKLPLLPLAGAGTRFAPIWADDLARAVVACLQNPHSMGQSLDLTGPPAIPWPNWCAM